MEARRYAVCQRCGKKLQYTDCSPNCDAPEDARCRMLKGWLSVCYCVGIEGFECYQFCSFACIQMWIDSKSPKVPESFLKAFVEE